ncbi:MAG: hypothetical protein Q9203_007340, partial [Teloschistes exilis]
KSPRKKSPRKKSPRKKSPRKKSPRKKRSRKKRSRKKRSRKKRSRKKRSVTQEEVTQEEVTQEEIAQEEVSDDEEEDSDDDEVQIWYTSQIKVRIKRGNGADYVQKGEQSNRMARRLLDLFQELTWKEIKEKGLYLDGEDDPTGHNVHSLDPAASISRRRPLEIDNDDESGAIDDEDFLVAETTARASKTTSKRRNSSKDAPRGKKVKLDDACIPLAQKILQRTWGFPTFRLKQEEVIARLVSGNSAVVNFPPGGGKSLVYQIPALAFDEYDKSCNLKTGGGVILVVSPLIALMKDRVDALKKRGVSAAAIDSTQSREAWLDTMERLRNNTLKLFLRLLAESYSKREEKLSALRKFLKPRKSSSIVYVQNHVQTEEVCKSLKAIGLNAYAYHAGMQHEVRTEVQEKFMRTKNIIANALGLLNAQLELRWELFRATTPKYAKYQYVKTPDFDTNTSEDSSVTNVLKETSKTAKKWTHIDVELAASYARCDRTLVVRKLQDWHNNGDIELQPSGVINRFRVLKEFPQGNMKKEHLASSLHTYFETSEKDAMARIYNVVDLITARACLTRGLARHFGDEKTVPIAGCGHCSFCITRKPVLFDREQNRSRLGRINEKKFRAILTATTVRDDPRFLARVAFGISSPRVTKEKLGTHEVFGSMDDCDFEVCKK